MIAVSFCQERRLVLALRPLRQDTRLRHPISTDASISSNSPAKSMLIVIFKAPPITADSMTDKITPSIPPIRAIAPDSHINSARMELLHAPMDFLMPIS